MELFPGSPSSPESSSAVSWSRVYHSAWAISLISTRMSVAVARAKKRPRLAAEIAQLREVDVNLFTDFSVDGLLQRLPRLNKAGEHRNAIPPRCLATQQ